MCEPWCWYIYLQNWAIYGVNGGKYCIHGAYGYHKLMFNRIVLWANQFGMRPLKQKHMGYTLISIHEKDFQQSQELKKTHGT